MQFENQMTFVRALKGAPASVLWAFVITQRMMTALELQQWTGYKGDNLTVALRLLVDLGWVVARSSRGPWGLAEGRQLPLMPGIDQLRGPVPPDSDLIGFRGGVVNDVDISFSSPTNTTTTLTASRKTPIKSDSLDEGDRAKLAALDAAGIRGKKARELIRLEWVTVQYINAHAAAIAGEDWDNPQGMMIYRIEGNEPVIELRKNGHKTSCRCFRCLLEDRRNRASDEDEEGQETE